MKKLKKSKKIKTKVKKKVGKKPKSISKKIKKVKPKVKFRNINKKKVKSLLLLFYQIKHPYSIYAV